MHPRTLIPAALMLVCPMSRSAYADNFDIAGTFRVSPASHRLSVTTYARNGRTPLGNVTATGPDAPGDPLNPPGVPASYTTRGWTLDVDAFTDLCEVTEWRLEYTLPTGWALEQGQLCVDHVPFAYLDLLAGLPVTVGHTVTGDPVTWEIDGLTPLAETETSPLSFPIYTVYTHTATARMEVGMDIFAFLESWFAGEPAADVDGSGRVTQSDLWAFLTTYFD